MSGLTRGLFVVVEGPDGSGKSTLTQGLAARLGARAATTPEPCVRAVRASVLAGLTHSRVAQQAFYLATVENESERIRAEVADGGSVVLDRYLLSTMVYAQQRGAHLRWPELEARLVVPQLTVFVDVPLAVRTARMEARGMSEADVETLDPTFDAGLRAGYEAWSSHRAAGTFVRLALHGTETPEEVEALAWTLVVKAAGGRTA